MVSWKFHFDPLPIKQTSNRTNRAQDIHARAGGTHILFTREKQMQEDEGLTIRQLEIFIAAAITGLEWKAS